MKKVFINVVKFLVFLGVGLVILFLVYRKQNAAFQEDCGLKGIPAADCSLLQKVIGDFAGVNYFWILMVLLAFTISNISRALRWNMLLRPLGYRPRIVNSFLTVVMGYFANLGLPRLGEVVRAGLLARYERIPVEKVMGTVVADRAIDVLSILLVTALAFLLEYGRIWQFVDEHVSLTERLGGGGNLLLLLMAAGGAFVLFVYLFRRRLARTSVYRKVKTLAFGFLEGIQTVRRLDRPGLFLIHSVIIWLMYYLMTYVCFFAFEPTRHLSPLAALVVFVFGGWGIVVPSPGGMGTYHFLAQTALIMYGISGDDGFSWANISFFSIQLGCNVLIGLLGLILLPPLNRDYHPRAVVDMVDP